MPPSQDPIDKMSPADKLLRVGTFGSLALLLLLVTIQSFRDGAPRDPAQQVADAPDVEESVDMAGGEAAGVASDDADMAEATSATEAPVDATETAEAGSMAEEPAAEVETAEADTAPADAPDTTDAAAPSDDTTETVVAQADAPAAEAEVEAVNWLQDSPLLASADIAAGESAFRQCAACHQYAIERNGGGPHLVGIVGRDMASVENWRYSNALLEQDGIWTPEKLNQWLINPDDYIPGNRMAYPGVRDAQDRINIIGFLASQGQ